MPATRKKNAPPDYRKLLIVGILLILLFAFRPSSLKKNENPAVKKEEVSQLTSADTYLGNAVSSRSYSDGKYQFNLTAFLGASTPGQTYKARLVNETLDPQKIELGELIAAGDVYTLRYESETDYRKYSQVEVFSLNNATKEEKVLLKGTF